MAVAIASHPRETVAIVMATAATITIFVNALFLQRGPHPAPIFATRPLMRSVMMPPARVTVSAPTGGAIEGRGQLIVDIQEALSRKGFYDGAIDGLWGAKTDSAVRDFLRAAGSTASAEASENLLRTIRTASVHAGQPAVQRPDDPIARLLAPSAPPPPPPAPVPSKQVLAVQRVLADFGYGQIEPTGIVDGGTRTAIEKFEREHGMPVDGQVSDKLLRALGAMSGRPLE
ncbi:MAG TPA: peptidoglycan-binding domain-containing protein [Pseudolabrys sp.]|nr:peptidoglycan-binding domain-containing protein [Pseudolabrys sp.]